MGVIINQHCYDQNGGMFFNQDFSFSKAMHIHFKHTEKVNIFMTVGKVDFGQFSKQSLFHIIGFMKCHKNEMQ